MQPGIADVVAVAKAAAQLWAAVFCAGVVIGTLHHIHTPDAVTGLQFFWGKARRQAENLSLIHIYLCARGAAGRLSAHHRRAGRGLYRLQAAEAETGRQDAVAHCKGDAAH